MESKSNMWFPKWWIFTMKAWRWVSVKYTYRHAIANLVVVVVVFVVFVLVIRSTLWTGVQDLIRKLCYMVRLWFVQSQNRHFNPMTKYKNRWLEMAIINEIANNKLLQFRNELLRATKISVCIKINDYKNHHLNYKF